MPLLVRGSLISPTDKLNYDPIPHALIYVGDDGIIKSIKQIAPADALETEDAFLAAVGHHGKCEKLKLARGEFLIPGFVDTHCVRALGYYSPTPFDRAVVTCHSILPNFPTSERAKTSNSWNGSITSSSRWKLSSRTWTSPRRHMPKA